MGGIFFPIFVSRKPSPHLSEGQGTSGFPKLLRCFSTVGQLLVGGGLRDLPLMSVYQGFVNKEKPSHQIVPPLHDSQLSPKIIIFFLFFSTPQGFLLLIPVLTLGD